MTQAEERELDLKAQQLQLDAQKRTAEISEKEKKVEIDRQDIIYKVKSLKEKLSSINKASSLTDQEIRQHLSESAKWEGKLENIIEARVKLSKQMVGLTIDQAEINELDEATDDLKQTFKEKLGDLKEEDNKRSLFSQMKSVKEDFIKKLKNPKTWQAEGFQERLHVIANLLRKRKIAGGVVPKLDFFPSSPPEMDRDRDIPDVDYFLQDNSTPTPDEARDNDDDFTSENVANAIACQDCGEVVPEGNQTLIVQSEMKEFV